MRSFPAPLALAALLAMLGAAVAAAPSAARGDAPAQAPAHVTGTAVIEDGDTLDLGPVPIRLHGIDAPEAGQRCATASGGQWACGAVATARLDALAGGRELRCLARDVDLGLPGRPLGARRRRLAEGGLPDQGQHRPGRPEDLPHALVALLRAHADRHGRGRAMVLRRGRGTGRRVDGGAGKVGVRRPHHRVSTHAAALDALKAKGRIR